MVDFEEQALISDARKYASAASFSIQKLPEDTIEREALHNLLSAIESLIRAIDPQG